MAIIVLPIDPMLKIYAGMVAFVLLILVSIAMQVKTNRYANRLITR
jgi:hypothetical protein